MKTGKEVIKVGILFSKVEQDMDCPKEVVIWNYWDREHLTGTHYLHYSRVKIIAEQDNWCLAEFTMKLPYLPFNVINQSFCYMVTPDHMCCIQTGKFTTLKQDFYFEDDGPEACKVSLENRMNVPLPEVAVNWLMPIWQKFSTKWFLATWAEDLPMRRRRWKVWNLGFRDFVGIDYINQKKAKPEGRGETPRFHPVELPVKKTTPIAEEGWPRLFSTSVEVGYGSTSDAP